MKRNQSRVILLSGSRTRARRLAEDLRDYNLSSFYSEDMDREVEPGEIMTAYGYIAEGYEYPLLNFVVISETDIFGKNKRKKKRRTTYEGRKIQSFSELKPGDYVVHENHGLGIYQGIEKIEVDKISKDYMKISYAKGGNLYIPATSAFAYKTVLHPDDAVSPLSHYVLGLLSGSGDIRFPVPPTLSQTW